MRSAVLAALLAVAFVTVACGPGQQPSRSTVAPSPSAAAVPTVFPVVASSELAVGPNRVLVSFLDATNQPVAAPDRTVELTFTGPGGETVEAPTPQFIWAVEDVRGVYVTNVEFPIAGDWVATFVTSAPGAPAEQVPVEITVRADASALRPGEAAPAVDTPTADDVDGDLALLSTDTAPEPRFYETSVADALAAGEPFVLAFATPKFCATAQCGPTLERLKAIAANHPDLTFINVEPYALEPDVNGQLQPVRVGDPPTLQPVEAVRAFGLLTEPYVYVVDGDGTVAGAFEIIFADSEIEAAISALG
jgi:hypothetical protein